jgi:hypothetical protein
MTDTAKLIKVAELLGRRAAVTNPALRRLAKKAKLRKPLNILIKRAAVVRMRPVRPPGFYPTVQNTMRALSKEQAAAVAAPAAAAGAAQAAARAKAARQQAARQQAARQQAAQQRAAQQRAAAPAAATAKAAAPAAAAFGQGRFGKGLKTTGRVGGLLGLGTMLGVGGLGLYNWLSKPKQQAPGTPGTKKWTPYEQSMFARMNINPEQYSQEFDALRDFFQGQQMKNMRQRYLNAQLQQMAM